MSDRSVIRLASRSSDLSSPENSHLTRLCARIGAAASPVVWVRGIAGCGKSTLMRALARRSPPAGGCELLDEPQSGALAALLADASRRTHPGSLVVASRPGGSVERALLAPRLYGAVEVIGERELFLTPEQCDALGGQRAAGERFDLTGGWPMLVQADLTGRAGEVCSLLPEFMAQEVLPTLRPALVAALFAAAVEPLGDRALGALLGAQAPLHPLLRSSPAGVIVAGRWTRDALLALLRSGEAIDAAARARLVETLRDATSPARAIAALNAMNCTEEAASLFDAAGGPFFGFRHGFPALQQALESFSAGSEVRRENLLLARLFLLFKAGQSHEALRRLDAHYPRLPVDLRRMQVSHRVYPLLLRLDIAAGFDEALPAEVVTSWARLEAFMAPEDHLARGVLYNVMTLGYLRAEALPQARQLAQEALGAYRRGESPYLMYFMQLHLADIALRECRLGDADRLLADATDSIARSGFGSAAERAMLDIFRARLDYERGLIEQCPADIEATLEALTAGDSWPNLIRTLLGFAPLVAFWRHGLRAAIETAERCVLTLGRRHGPTEDRGLSLRRIRIFQVARRHSEAAGRLAELDLQPSEARASPLSAEEALIRLRVRLAQTPPLAARPRESRALLDIPELETRERIAAAILQAELQRRLGEHAASRRHLLLALRLAQPEGLVGVMLEEAEYLERLLPPLLADPGPGNESLGQFAQQVAALLRELPATGLRSKAVAGVSRQELKVLMHLSDGCTNKTIARALGLSESAVKFHLRNLFRKLGAAGRAALLQRAREVGLIR